MSDSANIAEAIRAGDPGAWADMATAPTIEVFEAALERLAEGGWEPALVRAGFLAAAANGAKALVQVFDRDRAGADYVALALAASRSAAAVPVLEQLLGDHEFGTIAVAGLSRQPVAGFRAVAEACRGGSAARRIDAVRVLSRWPVEPQWLEVVLDMWHRERVPEVLEALEPLVADARGEVSTRTIDAIRRAVSVEESEMIASHLQQALYDGHPDFLPPALLRDPAAALVVAFDHLDLLSEGTRLPQRTWWTIVDFFEDHPVKWWLAAELITEIGAADALTVHLRRLSEAGPDAVTIVARRFREFDVSDATAGPVIDWLAQHVTDDDVDWIARGLGSTDTATRNLAEKALVAFGPPGTIAALEYLDHSRADHRAAAARVVVSQPCRPAKRAVLKALESEGTATVREILIEAWFAVEDLFLSNVSVEDPAWQNAFEAAASLRGPFDELPVLEWKGSKSEHFSQWFYLRLHSQNLRGLDPMLRRIVSTWSPEQRERVRLEVSGDEPTGTEPNAAFSWVLLAEPVDVCACRVWADSADGRGEGVASARVRALKFAGEAGHWVLENWSRNGRYRPHVDLARAALEQLGGVDSLARNVPDLGWDESGERSWSIGTRDSLSLTWSRGRIEFRNESGDVLKSVPRGRAGDPEQLVERDLGVLRNIREASTFIARLLRDTLEGWMLNAVTIDPSVIRRWANHPLARDLATRVVWVEERVGQPPRALRLSEEGGFEDSMDRQQWPTGRIRVAHPADMTDEEREDWTRVFADYEIVQPFKQLDRRVFRPLASERSATKIKRFHRATADADRIRWAVWGSEWSFNAGGAWCRQIVRTWEKWNVTAVVRLAPGFSIRDDDTQQTIVRASLVTSGDEDRADLTTEILLDSAPPLVFSEIVDFLTTVIDPQD